MIINRPQQELKFLLQREQLIRSSRSSFWQFCRTMAPDFYRPKDDYLKLICDTLQDFYQNKLINPATGKPFNNFRLSTGPRLGKSRTLINFSSWIFGHETDQKIMTVSYNDQNATDFSKYTRDTIAEEKILPYRINYSDIFPETKIKHGSSSLHQWALEGTFFSYKGATITGGLTGKGGKILIGDDLIKDSIEAFNEKHLEKVWLSWGNLMTRKEPGAKVILNMTRWADGDPVGRIMASPDSINWYHLVMPVWSEQNGFLCPDRFGPDELEYFSNPKNFNEYQFKANYLQQPLTKEGNLYNQFLAYHRKPPKFEQIINYTDCKDKGKDYFCSINAGIYKGQAYILNVIYTDEPLNKELEKLVARMIYNDDVKTAYFESNGAGAVIMRNIQDHVFNIYESRKTNFNDFHQSKNKQSRILNNVSGVEYNVFYPENWKELFPDFYRSLTQFKKTFSGQPDDGPDAITGIVEKMNETDNFAIWTM